MDAFKFMEEAIAASGLNEGATRVTYGACCDAKSYFQEEAKQYDLEGPKNLMDGDALAGLYA